ncbi:unnamed protein product [Brachionus calyciflorus]|uniref:Uncharacterized protein n=1 Tax=Brachionus calyciflorus TaxID=104777 RepID=A0A814IU50_9BILA|nr:unnamed protein product [Brachionus calyciflorus]
MDNEENTRYYVRDFNENGEIRKVEISNETLEEIEHLNEMKDEINRILVKCKKLVGSFKHNCPTRWNSSYNMIESIIINKEALAALSYEPENSTIKDKVLDNSEIKQMEEFMKLFEIFRDITEILSGQLYVTILLIFPIIYSLMNYELHELSINSYELRKIRTELINSLKNRFYFIFEEEIFIASTFLNYRYKDFSFIRDFQDRQDYLAKAKNYLHKIFKETFSSPNSSDL